MSGKHNSVIAVIGIDIGKNSFHVVGLGRAIPLAFPGPFSYISSKPPRWR